MDLFCTFTIQLNIFTPIHTPIHTLTAAYHTHFHITRNLILNYSQHQLIQPLAIQPTCLIRLFPLDTLHWFPVLKATLNLIPLANSTETLRVFFSRISRCRLYLWSSEFSGMDMHSSYTYTHMQRTKKVWVPVLFHVFFVCLLLTVDYSYQFSMLHRNPLNLQN